MLNICTKHDLDSTFRKSTVTINLPTVQGRCSTLYQSICIIKSSRPSTELFRYQEIISESFYTSGHGCRRLINTPIIFFVGRYSLRHRMETHVNVDKIYPKHSDTGDLISTCKRNLLATPPANSVHTVNNLLVLFKVCYLPRIQRVSLRNRQAQQNTILQVNQRIHNPNIKQY